MKETKGMITVSLDKKIGKENTHPVEIGEAERIKLLFMSEMWGRVNAYGDDSHDEFSISDLNGKKKGVFKTWAHPIIPFLDTPHLGDFATVCRQIKQTEGQKSFEENVLSMIDTSDNARSVRDVLDKWVSSAFENPDVFFDTIERVRIDALQIDRRLIEAFDQEKLSDNPVRKLNQLANRLALSIGLMSPFYDIEAILGDTKGFQWNPISIAQANISSPVLGGGKLDLVGLCLPSYLKDKITANKLDWNGLSWDQIKLDTQHLLQDKGRANVLLRLSEIVGVPVDHILFAANALEWIPESVGGKKDDYQDEIPMPDLFHQESDEGEKVLEKLIRKGQDVNALIRFLNWFPAIECTENIDTSSKWSYSSISQTSEQLLNLLEDNPELLADNLRNKFKNDILPQLAIFDATSAKGRALLELIFTNSLLKHPLQEPFPDKNWQEKVINFIVQKRKSEYVQQIGSGVKPRMLIGGKAFGLEEMINSFPLELNVPRGFYLTAESIEDLLKTDPVLWGDVINLSNENDPNKKQQHAKQIRNGILSLQIPDFLQKKLIKEAESLSTDLLAIRSSSYDEDTDGGVTGAGIYESILRVKPDSIDEALRACLASFFSEKALNFRSLMKHSDYPRFAVIIQPFIDGVGGVVYTRDINGSGKSTGSIIEVGLSADDVTSGGKLLATNDEIKSGKLATEIGINIQELDALAKSLKTFKGRDVDIEWIVDKSGNLHLLQLRSLPSEKISPAKKTPDFFVEIDAHESLSKVTKSIEDTKGNAAIILRGKRNLDTFQSEIFTALTKHGNRIAEIYTDEPIPLTSHFSNICSGLGITLKHMT